MKSKTLIFILLFTFSILLYSCKSNDIKSFTSTFSSIEKIELNSLSTELTIRVDENIKNNIELIYDEMDSENIKNDNNILTTSNKDFFRGELFIKNIDQIDQITINSKTTDIKLYSMKTTNCDIKAAVCYIYIAHCNIENINLESELVEYSYIHTNVFKNFYFNYSSNVDFAINNNIFDTFTIINNKNNFSFLTNTFKKGTIQKESGNLDISLPAKKGFYAEINCPNVLFDFETVSFENKYYYSTPEYELYITNPNGAVSITRYFPE